MVGGALMGELGESGLEWRPLALFGLESPFFSIDAHLVIQTWIVLLVLFIFCLPVRWLLRKRYGVTRYLILSLVRTFVGLCQQAMGTLIFRHLVFIMTIFLFIFLCNTITTIPWMKEPTQSLNTTLALGLISFFYVQFSGIRAHGVVGYLREYVEPLFVMAPLHVVGKLASIISMSFRLFGNIFGGAIISELYTLTIQKSVALEIIGLFSGLNFLVLLFFGLFEGFLQAFVFTMLSLTYLSIAIQSPEQPQGEAV